MKSASIFCENASDAESVIRFHSVCAFLSYWRDRESGNGAESVPDLMK